jgi:hypothetical protein
MQCRVEGCKGQAKPCKVCRQNSCEVHWHKTCGGTPSASGGSAVFSGGGLGFGGNPHSDDGGGSRVRSFGVPTCMSGECKHVFADRRAQAEKCQHCSFPYCGSKTCLREHYSESSYCQSRSTEAELEGLAGFKKCKRCSNIVHNTITCPCSDSDYRPSAPPPVDCDDNFHGEPPSLRRWGSGTVNNGTAQGCPDHPNAACACNAIAAAVGGAVAGTRRTGSHCKDCKQLNRNGLEICDRCISTLCDASGEGSAAVGGGAESSPRRASGASFRGGGAVGGGIGIAQCPGKGFDPTYTCDGKGICPYCG